MKTVQGFRDIKQGASSFTTSEITPSAATHLKTNHKIERCVMFLVRP